MLTKVVLPAPLLPIRLTRSPACTSSVIALAATSAPKRFSRPEADHEQQEKTERKLPGVREVEARERAHDLEHGRCDEDRQHALPAGEDCDEDELARRRPVAEVRV